MRIKTACLWKESALRLFLIIGCHIGGHFMKKIRNAVSFCRLSVFVLTRITDKAAFAVLFPSFLTLSLSLVHGCLSLACPRMLVLSCIVFCLLSYLYLVVFCLSRLSLRLQQTRSNELASELVAHGAVTGLLKN